MEDMLQLLRRYFDAGAPFDFTGNHWTVRNAYIGSIRTERPEVWVTGGAHPRVMRLAAKYADGFCFATPMNFATPDRLAEFVPVMRRLVEEGGRDPDAFGFQPWHTTVLHEPGSDVSAFLDNPLVKWTAAIYGRLNNADWADEGVTSIFPPDWHYGLKLLPHDLSKDEVDDIVSRVSPQMVEKSFHIGTTSDVAKDLAGYIDAGATHIAIADMLPLVFGLEEAAPSLARQFEVLRLLRDR